MANKTLHFSIKQKSFCLGFVISSIILIIFSQLFAYIGNNVLISSATLTAILLGLMLGFTLIHFKKELIDKFSALIYGLASMAIAIILSTIFIKFLLTYFNSTITLIIILILMALTIFSQLGVLLAENLTETRILITKKLIYFTMGILLGIVTTELVLLNLLGVAWAIVLNTCLLLWCVIFDFKSLSQEVINFSMAIATVVIAFGFNVQLSENDIFHQAYRAINDEVYEPVAPEQLLSSDLFKTVANKATDNFPYLHLLRHILYNDLDISNKDVLILGEGGYHLSRQDNKDIHFTYLNYSKKNRPNACSYLNVLSEGNTVITKDSKLALNQRGDYDVIVSNVFPIDYKIPASLLSYQQIQKVRDALPKKGIAIFNVVARPTLTDSYSKRVDNTIRAVFPSCMEIPLVYSDKPTNIIYICRKSNVEYDNAIYTNNFNTARLDFLGGLYA